MFHFRKPLHDTLPATRSLRISSALPIKEATQSKIHNMWLTVDHIMQCFLIWFRLMVHTLLDHHKVLLSTGTREVHLMSSYATTPIKILYFISLYALKQVTWNIHTNETTITLACSEPKALSNTSKANSWPRRAIHKKNTFFQEKTNINCQTAFIWNILLSDIRAGLYEDKYFLNRVKFRGGGNISKF